MPFDVDALILAATAVVAETRADPFAAPDVLARPALSEMTLVVPFEVTLIAAAIAVVAFTAEEPVTLGDTRARVDRST